MFGLYQSHLAPPACALSCMILGQPSTLNRLYFLKFCYRLSASRANSDPLDSARNGKMPAWLIRVHPAAPNRVTPSIQGARQPGIWTDPSSL